MNNVINLLAEKGHYCSLIKKAFNPNFCDKIMVEYQDAYTAAKTHYPTSYRNNDRQVLDNKALSEALFDAIKKYIPPIIECKGISHREIGKWKLDSLNSRIRICRYRPNQYFNKHLDGVHYVSDNKQSKLTFMIYLNGSEEFEGGRTFFFDSKNDDNIIGHYRPEKGDLIVFDHNLWHSGERVLKGEKYILRSDIIYQKMDAGYRPESNYCAEGHLGYIWTANLLGNQLITSGRDKKIKIWSEQGTKIAELKGHSHSIVSMIVFDNKHLVSASRDASIKIWSKNSEQNFVLNQSIDVHRGAVLALAKVDQATFVSGGADGMLHFLNIDGTLLKSIKAHDDWIWDLVCINKQYLASVSEDAVLKIWDIEHLRCCCQWQTNQPINSVAILERILVIGTYDGTIIKFKFDAENHLLQKLDSRKCHDGIIRKLIFDEQYMYSASEDNRLKIWNIDNWSYIGSIEHQNFVQDIALTTNHIISVSYDGRILKSPKPTLIG